MKKTVLFLCCLLIAILGIGCGTPSNSAPRLVRQTMIEKNGATTVTNYEYNKKGQMVRYEILSGSNVDTVKEVKYDRNGYKNYEKGTSGTGFITEVYWTNDKQGRPISQRIVTNYKGNKTESISQFEYTDEYGSYVQTMTSGASVGNTVTVVKDEHGNEITHVELLGVSMRYENTYDGDVLVERISTQTTPGGLTVTKTKYEYGENGDLIKETSYDSEGKVTLTQTYEYEIPNSD